MPLTLLSLPLPPRPLSLPLPSVLMALPTRFSTRDRLPSGCGKSLESLLAPLPLASSLDEEEAPGLLGLKSLSSLLPASPMGRLARCALRLNDVAPPVAAACALAPPRRPPPARLDRRDEVAAEVAPARRPRSNGLGAWRLAGELRPLPVSASSGSLSLPPEHDVRCCWSTRHSPRRSASHATHLARMKPTTSKCSYSGLLYGPRRARASATARASSFARTRPGTTRHNPRCSSSRRGGAGPREPSFTCSEQCLHS